MIKVAVVILNWNGQGFLKKFLPSVINNSPQQISEVWVADNGSDDESVEIVKREFPSVKILQLDKNYGFTGGYNRALKHIKSEYFVLLNSDVEVTPNWIEPIVEYLDKNTNIAAAMPKVLSYDNKEYFEYAGAAGGFIDKFGFPFCRGRIISKIEKDKGQYNKESEIFWATGACLFVKAKLFNEVGGLDEDFFAHMEEIDLCWRLKNRAYKIMYIPQSQVYHVGGGTLPNNNPKKIFLNYRNNLYLLYKNLPKGRFIYILFFRMVLDGLSAVMYVFQGKVSFFLSVFKAHIEFYKTLKSFKQKREENISKTIEFNHTQVFKRSIIFSFFVRQTKTFDKLKSKGWR